MVAVIVSGLAIGAVYAITALIYNLMYATSKVLSVTTGHICMLGGVFGAWFTTVLGWPILLGLVGAVGIGILFGLMTELVAVRRLLARSDEHLWLLSTLALATMTQARTATLQLTMMRSAGNCRRERRDRRPRGRSMLK